MGLGSVPSLVIFVGGAAMLVAFVLVERRAAEPILPLWVFRRRVAHGRQPRRRWSSARS